MDGHVSFSGRFQAGSYFSTGCPRADQRLKKVFFSFRTSAECYVYDFFERQKMCLFMNGPFLKNFIQNLKHLKKITDCVGIPPKSAWLYTKVIAGAFKYIKYFKYIERQIGGCVATFV